MPWLPVLFIVIPFTELMILLKVGEAWGVFPTLALIITTAMVGYQLFKRQGVATWQRVNQKLAQGELPSKEMADGIVILLAGALMITPGLITDSIGLFCLIPVTRKLVLSVIMRRFKDKVTIYSAHSYHSSDTNNESQHSSNNAASNGSGRTFEGDYQEEDKPPSGRLDDK